MDKFIVKTRSYAVTETLVTLFDSETNTEVGSLGYSSNSYRIRRKLIKAQKVADAMNKQYLRTQVEPDTDGYEV